MRTLNFAQFKRILQGVDLEYRIMGYSIAVERKVKFSGIHIPYDLSFFQCQFDQVEFESCRFSGNISIDNSSCKSLSFHDCQLQNINIKDSTVEELTLSNSSEIRALDVYNSKLNSVEIFDNPIFQEISLGCKNKIRNCSMSNVGALGTNAFQSNIYSCPEQFERFELKQISTDILHIGTFGDYAKLSLEGINSDYVVFENCKSDTSQIEIIDLKSRKAELGQIHFVNTAFDSDVFKINEIKPHFNTQIHHEFVDIKELVG